MRTQVTRRGRMGVIVLDDGSARVELVVYSELFESARNWLKEDQLLIVEARVSNKGGEDEYGDDCGLRPISCMIWTTRAHVMRSALSFIAMDRPMRGD